MQNYPKIWINCKIVLTEAEATEAIIFGVEENTRRVYLSGKILSLSANLTFTTGLMQKNK